MAEDNSDILEYSGVKLIVSSRKLYIDNAMISLRNKEFNLLEYFMRNIGKVLTRTRLLEDVWDRNFICPTNTVDVHVSGLRQKFRRYLHNDLIKTIPCVGYMIDI